MKAIGYIRVSTEDQADQGVSLGVQRERITAWCAAHDYDLAAVHVDAGLSGKRADNRPALQRALDDAAVEPAAYLDNSPLLFPAGRLLDDLEAYAVVYADHARATTERHPYSCS